MLAFIGIEAIWGSSGSIDDSSEQYNVDEDESEMELSREIGKVRTKSGNMFWRVQAKGLIAGVINMPRRSY